MIDKVHLFIDRFNTAWIEDEIQNLETLLHENVIFIAPDLKTKISGRKACLQSICDYVSKAKTMVFEVKRKEIDIWDHTAIVSITYYIEYSFDTQFFKETGTEFWTLILQNGQWKLIWRVIAQNEKIE